MEEIRIFCSGPSGILIFLFWLGLGGNIRYIINLRQSTPFTLQAKAFSHFSSVITN